MVTTTESSTKQTVTIPETIVVREFAKRLALPVNRLIGELVKNGVMATVNDQIDYETAMIVADTFGFTVQKALSEEEFTHARESSTEIELDTLLAEPEGQRLEPRPPVVVVMGHVDHGKTKLLDRIRATDVVASESGGITQHIGAYQITEKNRPLTFIDTPGHQAFTAMRSRGARVADVAILVVAADDGVKPQTKEAVEHIRAAKLPFLVAINKIDKPEANLDKTKQQLAEIGIQPEDWGGTVTCVPVSATAGTGIDELLDMVLLVADVEKEARRANPNRPAVGSVIESRVDKGEGPVATVIIQTGTLKTGDLITVGTVAGKVKALKDFRGQTIPSAPPSTPVRILGLKGQPAVGDILQVVTDRSVLKEKIKKHVRAASALAATRAISASGEAGTTPTTTVPIVLKTDVLGSQEAIEKLLRELTTDQVRSEIVHRGLGNITEADVLRAAASKALLVGFNVTATARAESVARERAQEIKTFTVIYHLVDLVRGELERLLPKEIVREDVGELAVAAIFRNDKKGMVVGGRVVKGMFKTGMAVAVFRAGTEIGRGTARQLRVGKDAVGEVTNGLECGVQFEGATTIAVGDRLVAFTETERAGHLAPR